MLSINYTRMPYFLFNTALINHYFADFEANGGVRILVLILVAPLVQILIRWTSPFFVKIALAGIPGRSSTGAAGKRVKTLAGVIEKTSFVIITISVFLSILSALNIDIKPFLTGAGIISLAFGFGAQSLIKDVIAGLFILLENQYNKGDWVQIDSFEGRVADINLRRTILETSKGSRHIIPNGRIGIVTNTTNNFSAVVLDIPIKMNSDFARKLADIGEIGREMGEDPSYKKRIVEIPHVAGVETVNEATALVKVWGKTRPGAQILVKRELAKRIAEKFSEVKTAEESK